MLGLKKGLQRTFLVATCILIGASSFAYAAPRKVNPSQLKTSTVTYKKKKTKIYCLVRTPGSIKKVGKSTLFTSYAEQIKKLTSRRDRTKKETLTAINKLAVAQCKKLALPTPTPTATPTATPTPDPTFSPGNFDANGNVTDAGKALFEIPSHLSGNISLGRDVFDSYCFGCHIERVNRTFPDIRYNIARPPMNYDSNDIPDADLANLIAYLNRFRF